MLFYLFLLFVVLPMVELALLLALADSTSWQFALGLVILTGVLGATLARWQGWKTYVRIQQELASQRMPTDSLLDAGMILVASAFLLTPGMMTDVFGFSLLIPPCRTLYRQLIKNHFKGRFQIKTSGMFDQTSSVGPAGRSDNDQIIDSYVVDSGGGDHERPIHDGGK